MSVGKSVSRRPRPARPLSVSAVTAPPSAVLERLMRVVEAVGPDVALVPREPPREPRREPTREAHWVLRRHQTFGAIRETSRGVMLGLYLPGTLVGDRLLDGVGFRLNRVSHQVLLRSLDDIDDELRVWLRRAYDRG